MKCHYRNATIYYGNKYTSASSHIDDLQCNGDETDLQECKLFHLNVGFSNCNRTNTAVSVNCRKYKIVFKVSQKFFHYSHIMHACVTTK